MNARDGKPAEGPAPNRAAAPFLLTNPFPAPAPKRPRVAQAQDRLLGVTPGRVAHRIRNLLRVVLDHYERRQRYVQGNVVQLTHRSAAPSSRSTPTTPNSSGRPAPRQLDPADARVDSTRRAQIGQTVREVRTCSSTTARCRPDREPEAIWRAHAARSRRRRTSDAARALVRTGAVGKEELNT